MSREIKFRAWDKESRGWIYSKPMPDMSFWKWVQYDNTTIFNQYTGLKDRKGVEIYEGDIVEEPGSRYEVVYHADGFYMRNMYEPDNMLIQLRHGYLHCEVIGNIYENPELLASESNKEGR